MEKLEMLSHEKSEGMARGMGEMLLEGISLISRPNDMVLNDR